VLLGFDPAGGTTVPAAGAGGLAVFTGATGAAGAAVPTLAGGLGM
jgi:hypothetical protein